MSETDLHRLALLGVGPNSQSLKFLNNKNNIADKLLQRQLVSIERQKTLHMNVIEHQKLDTAHFLKHVRNLEQDTQEAKRLLQGQDSLTPEPRVHKERRRRKIRLAQTAPAHMKHSDSKPVVTKEDIERKHIKSGPETQTEKDKMLQVDRKKSMFLQLTGRGKPRVESNTDTTRNKNKLPKPNSKTLLDVMIGLNAFSYVPSPRHNSVDFADDSRSETRSSIIEGDSLYGSSENIAQKFITNWRNKIASRKPSIFRRLDMGDMARKDSRFIRSDSMATSCIPEEMSLTNSFRKRKSKWTVRHSMRAPTLPVIGDEEERMQQFLEYVKEEKEREKREIHPAFAKVSVGDKVANRRKSFIMWLQNRKKIPKQRNNYFDENEEEDEEEEKLAFGGLNLQNDDEDDRPTDIGELMKTILKIKTHFRDPLDNRVKKFMKELDKMKERDDAAQQSLTKKERKRRWIALTKGIDAALADSSDDEDYGYYNAF